MNRSAGEDKPLWNSLEVARLITSILTPLAIFWFGALSTDLSHKRDQAEKQAAERIAQEQQRGSRIVERRLQIYEQMGEHLNDIYCYYKYVGNWKELKPTDIVVRKRALDKLVYSWRPLFSPALFDAYQRFIDACFKPYGGWRRDARLRTQVTERREAGAYASEGKTYKWDPRWEQRFTGEDSRESVQAAYLDLMAQFKKELNL